VRAAPFIQTEHGEMNNLKESRRPARGDDGAHATAALLREGIALALITVLLYLTAGAIAFGYQDQFGFTYLSLGLEDLVISSRAMILQLVLAPLALVLVWAILRAAIPKVSLSLTGLMFLALPLAIVFAFWLTTFRTVDLLHFNIDIYLTLVGYYALELIWWAAHRGWPKFAKQIDTERVALRLIQACAGALSLLLLAFNLGVAEAEGQTSFAFCPKDAVGVESVMVQMTDEVLVCAEVDVIKRLVYSRFRYVKIGDSGDESKLGGVVLETRTFSPRCIGVPRNRGAWTPMEMRNCS